MTPDDKAEKIKKEVDKEEKEKVIDQEKENWERSKKRDWRTRGKYL